MDEGKYWRIVQVEPELAIVNVHERNAVAVWVGYNDHSTAQGDLRRLKEEYPDRVFKLVHYIGLDVEVDNA